MAKTRPRCIYCDAELRKIRKGEHIIPRSLGSTKTIRSVCNDCNNSFSILDEQLVKHSPVHWIDYRRRATKGGNWYDIDVHDDNLIFQAYPDKSQSTWTAWPQVIFCEQGPQIRADLDEIEKIGAEEWQAIFFKHLCAALERHNNGDSSAIHFAPNSRMSSFGRYPPRVFAERRICEFGQGMRFLGKYLSPPEQAKLLAQITKLSPKTRLENQTTARGSSAPGAIMHGDAMLLYRALTKIGINALAYICTQTDVDRFAFREAVQFVQDGRLRAEAAKRLLIRCGFVCPEQLRSLECPKGSHVLHLCHYAGSHLWQMYFALFGGDVGGRIEFRGPNRERWASTTITAPIGGRWSQTYSNDIVAPDVRVVPWDDDMFLQKVVPSIPIVRESGSITVRRRDRRH